MHDPKMVEMVHAALRDMLPAAYAYDPKRRAAKAALDALAAAGRLVLEGWLAVPREPTREMLMAAGVAADRYAADCLGVPLPHEDVWTEMLAAAPRAEDQA